jgi:hypothetical protein
MEFWKATLPISLKGLKSKNPSTPEVGALHTFHKNISLLWCFVFVCGLLRMLVFWRVLRKGSRRVSILACVCDVGLPLGGVCRVVFRARFLDGRRGLIMCVFPCLNFLVMRAFPPSDRVAYIASDRLYFEVLMSAYTCWW